MIGMAGPATGPDVCDRAFQAILDSVTIEPDTDNAS
jgi:hypothetical protein